jgi:hypothetical protein
MAERDRDSSGSSKDHGHPGRRGFAEVTDIEEVTDRDGNTHTVFKAVSNCPVAATKLVEGISSMVQADAHYIGSVRLPDRTSSTFGFSGRWRMCDWQPKGPRKNWIPKPSKGPSLN